MTTTDGIILRRTPYLSSSVILDVLTPSEKIPVILRSVATGRTSAKLMETQPGSLVNLVLAHARGDAMQVVREISPDTHQADISCLSPYRSAQLLFICELTALTIKGRESGPELYDFLYQCILSLCSEAEKYICLRYTYQLARLLGFAPDNAGDCSAGYFDMQSGEFSLQKPLHKYYLTPNNAALFFSLGDVRRDAEISGSADYLKLWRILTTYFSLHIEGFHTPRSLDFLQQLTLLEHFPGEEEK